MKAQAKCRIAGSGTADAPLVFARDGWMVKSKNIDAYKGIDVNGKIVVLYGKGLSRGNRLTNPPDGVTRADLTGTSGTDWAALMSSAIYHAS